MFTLLSFGLIETWDVLKYCIWKHKKKVYRKINRNMGCIEILRGAKDRN